jgi:hypothetical protein
LKTTLGPETRVIDLTLYRIARYTQERLADGLAPATVNRNLAILRRGLRLGHRAGLVELVDPSVVNEYAALFEDSILPSGG